MGYRLIPCTWGQVGCYSSKATAARASPGIGGWDAPQFRANAKNGSIDKVETVPSPGRIWYVLVMVDDDTKMEALSSTHYVKSIITAETPMDLERKKEQSQGDMYARFMAFPTAIWKPYTINLRILPAAADLAD